MNKDSEKSINGRVYPFWNQFVEKQDTFIGCVLEDLDAGMTLKTKVTGISLNEKGCDSAFFSIEGEDFSCGFDTKYGGVTTGEAGWLTFNGPMGKFRVNNKALDGAIK